MDEDLISPIVDKSLNDKDTPMSMMKPRAYKRLYYVVVPVCTGKCARLNL